MTLSFDSYPVGRQMLFIRATLDDVRWLMSEYPSYWNSSPGRNPFFEDERSDIQFREFYSGKSSPSDWLRILQPQNYVKRFFFIDVALPGWIAMIFEPTVEPRDIELGKGVYCSVAERDGCPPLNDPLGIAQIHIRYDLREPRIEYGPHWYGDRLVVGVYSTTMTSRFAENSSYVPGLNWNRYEIAGNGLPGFEGLDVPLRAEVPEHILKDYPSYCDLGFRKLFDLGPSYREYDKDPEASADYLKVLPFDHRGQERIVDFFNTRLVSQWLEETYGIRWNDPNFYEGESLLYIVGGPDLIKDPFTPRIPLEDYYRFQAIDLERNRKLIESGKF
ncbi:hypothetical protein [Corynebacterium glutamicum]|uniref:hypothetical protein n=1 Tax=Corynebacterium glutamicum TaxID=1718 RepID=UPI00058A1BB8|nr:hypothetical protein [Corynebacterium glutamicum]KIH72469.1 hypothetical protein SD36_14220 [Corynebacterium glutamicum]